jgi:hypothetical protein
MNKKNQTTKSLIRSSAAEYLSYIAAHGEGGVEAIYADEDIWLSQKMMGTLYQVETNTVNYHLKKSMVSGLYIQAMVLSICLARSSKIENTYSFKVSCCLMLISGKGKVL